MFNCSRIALAAALLSLAGAVSAGEVAREWLDRMHTALDK